MKKVLTLFIVFAMVISVAGCGSGGQPGQKSTANDQATDSDGKPVCRYTGMEPEEVLSKLTLEQKASQMVMTTVYGIHGAESMRKNDYGCVMSKAKAFHAPEWREVIDGLQRGALKSESGVPFIYGQDDLCCCLHDYKPQYGDPRYWTYPEGVEEKIEDDKVYRVWYISSDAADPSDSTIWNKVQYITYVPTEKTQIKAALTNIINILTFGK